MSTADIPFHQWLKRRRRALDLTVDALADAVGCSPNTLRKLESGERRPSRQLAELLAAQLRVPPQERELFLSYARTGQAAAEHALPLSPPGSAGAPPALTPSHLHRPLTRLIGREEQQRAVRAAFRRSAALVTLVGSGGVGKTRLAQELALELHASFPDGAHFVSLAALFAPELVLATVAGAIGLHLDERRGGEQGFHAALRDRRMLLVLDNFEQVVAAAPAVARLVAACPGLRVLVTSRVPLGVRGEQQVPVPPLAVPDTAHTLGVADLVTIPAVTLFVERAQAANPAFVLTPKNAGAVGAVCARLDGLPLAIELVAARARLLPPQALLDRLSGAEGALDLLAGGPELPERQQTLRAATRWSERLLSPGARRLFARLSCFVGGWNMAATEAICADDGRRLAVLDLLQELVDGSLVQSAPREDGETDLSMLVTVREYAVERLVELGEAEALGRRHAEHYAGRVEAELARLAGPTEVRAHFGPSWDNVRAAIRWSIGAGDGLLAGRFGVALWRLWWMAGELSEGRGWLEQILPLPGLTDGQRGRLLNGLSCIATLQGDSPAAIRAAEQALEIVRRMDDRRGIGATLTNLGNALSDAGDDPGAERRYLEALNFARENGDSWGEATDLNNLSNIARRRGDYALARERLNAALAIYIAHGDQHGQALTQSNLALLSMAEADYVAARRSYREAIAMKVALGNRAGIAQNLDAMARIAAALGEPLYAARLLGAAEMLRASLGITLTPALRAENEQTLALIDGQLSAAERERATALGQSLGFEGAIALAIEGDA